MEYSFCLFALVFIACFGKRIATTSFVCDENPVTLSCPENTVILLQEVTNGDSSCKTVDTSNTCFTIIQNNCTGKNKCTVLPNDLSMNGCKRRPRYIKTAFRCNWLFYKKELSTTTCADKIARISCSNFNNWILQDFEIEITDILFLENLQICSNCGSIKAKLLLAQFCDHQETCQNPSDDISCLFNPATIEYICQDSHSLTTTKSNMPLVTTTDSPSLTYTETTTKSNTALVTATVPVETQVYLKLDNEGRILLRSDMFGNVTVMLCGEGWDDLDAQVVCRYKENSTGEATVVKGVKDYETIPVVIQCQGNETNPFECNHSMMSKCNVSTVAAVSCCKDSSGSRRGCQISKVEQQSQSESANDIAIGLSVCLSIVIVIAVVVLVIKLRRSKRKKTVSSTINNVGNQGISLSNLDRKSKNLTEINTEYYSKRVFKYDERRHETSNKMCAAPNISSSSSGTASIQTTLEYDGYECTKSIGNVQNSASEDSYACSKDGVYDKVNTNRHLQNDSNVYSHSIDTVYDTSDRSSNNEQTAVTYDHFIGLKNDDNYDLAKRK